MADEVKEAVKEVVVDSASTTTQDGSVKTPPVESTGTKATEKEVPYDRFQEVIKQKNEEKLLRQKYEARISELERNLPAGQGGRQDPIVAKLVAGGIKEDVAKLMAEAQRDAVREANAPIEARESARNINSWMKDLERSDPDYKKLKPELEKAFNDLSEDEKRLAISSQKGLEWFYKSVKSEVLGTDIAKAREAGVKQGYEQKVLKEGMSGDPKSGNTTIEALTFESIRSGALKKLSDAEYTKRLPEINAILAKGPVRK